MENIVRLRNGLNRIHGTDKFTECETMGALTKRHIELMLFDSDFAYRANR